MEPVLAVLDGPLKDIGGGVHVRRLLPQIARRNVGPFVFFDHLGPADYAPGHGLDVRPHPHIGLATVTWLFEGAIVHRDSLGFHETIRPGDLNWMTAGRGITHSERTGPDDRARGGRVHGLQLWVALPDDSEEIEPSFHHYGGDQLPGATIGGAAVRLLVGAGWGLTSPVATLSPLFYAEVNAPAGAAVPVPEGHAELGVYVVSGAVAIGGRAVLPGQLAVLGAARTIEATEPTLAVILGGEPVGERHIFWNFVSSRKERNARAADDWRARRFPSIPGDDVEFIPLP